MVSRSRIGDGRRIVSIVLLIAFLALPGWGAGGTSVASADSRNAAPQAAPVSIKMAFSTWTGYGPLVVASQLGYFQRYGLNVTYNVVEDANARKVAIQAGRLDGVATTVDTFTRWAAQGAPIQIVLGIDRSAGGDGIVAKRSITSVRQLKGHTVAVSPGTVSEFFFDYVLRQNGMSISDVKLQDMPSSSDAGAAFAAGKVDAAVTWEPWLTRANSTGFGHILVSSAKYPNIIVDAFAFRTDFIRAHLPAVRNFIRAYFQAVNLVQTRPGVANKVIGKYVKETPVQVTGDLKKVPLMNLTASRAYFGTGVQPGPIYQTARGAANFWLRLGKISKMPNLRALINPNLQLQI